MYPIGTLKVTWVLGPEYTTLNSQMFKKQDLDKAIEYGKNMGGKDFMIFELAENKGDSYSWKLLPYGDAKKFVSSMKNQDSAIFKGIVLVGAGLAVYGLLNLLSK